MISVLKRGIGLALLSGIVVACGDPGKHALAEKKTEVSSHRRGIPRVLVAANTVITLGQSTFTDLIKEWGRGTIVPAATHDEMKKLCYRIMTIDGPVTLLLETDELGGPEMRIERFELFQDNTESSKACKMLAIPKVQLHTETGLHLGMPIDSVTLVTGRASQASELELEYAYDTAVTSTGRRLPLETADSINVVTDHTISGQAIARFLGNRLIFLRCSFLWVR